MALGERERAGTVSLRVGGTIALVAWVASAIVCAVGGVFKEAPWVYAASLILGGASAILFAIVVVGMVASGSRGGRPSVEARKATSQWWREAPAAQRVLVAAMIGLGLAIAVVGILGSAHRSGLVEHAGTYAVVTGGVQHHISASAYHSFRYSQYVLGVLGPAMALNGFVRLIVSARACAKAQPYGTVEVL